MSLTKRIEEHPWLFLLVLAIIGSIWKSYPHFMIAELLPSDEYNNWVLLEVMIREGKAFDFLLSPQLQYYLMYLFNRLTGIGSITLFKWTNGIIGGFSVFTFYYFCSGMLNKQQSLMAATLYTFSEPFFYRSCFLGSTEIFGLALMFVILGLYLRKKHLLIIPVVLFSAFIHLAPFVFSITTVITPFMLKRKTTPKAIAIGILMIALIFGPLSPHRKQKYEIFSSALDAVSLKNLFVYSLNEIVIVGLLSYLGFIALAFITIPKIKEWNRFEQILFIVSMGFMALSWIGYNSMIFSPRRMIVYMVIPMLTSVVKVVKTPQIYVGLVALMLLSPPLMGTQSFVWVNDAITHPELNAIDWLVENNYFNESEWNHWFSDRTVTQAINPHIFFFRPDRDPATASVNTKEELERLNNFVSGVHKEYEDFLTNESDTPLEDYSWRYIIISNRMKKQSFYLVRDTINGTRSKEIRIPTLDLWKNNPYFTDIYNLDGVIIYEKKTN